MQFKVKNLKGEFLSHNRRFRPPGHTSRHIVYNSYGKIPIKYRNDQFVIVQHTPPENEILYSQEYVESDAEKLVPP